MYNWKIIKTYILSGLFTRIIENIKYSARLQIFSLQVCGVVNTMRAQKRHMYIGCGPRYIRRESYARSAGTKTYTPIQH